MLLRESSRHAALDTDLQIVVGTSADPDGGIPHGAALRRFAQALVTDSRDLAPARAALCTAVGPERTAHAACVIASFDGINRVADAIGIQFEGSKLERTADLRDHLALDDMQTARMPT